ncbi:hypothetical protein EWM64_g3540 [Hericium alpestre]|uniref:Pyridoxamine 5'-phosphate oxidase Alr4036 family FMN-binding domain-containing protein n=1 Tax=Hericium alpestre TaxID=135208 RepID=A0A4Z0A025_9AGAM|nr:hypothetical protein EWM64_g3540 [Hericium alpestre]
MSSSAPRWYTVLSKILNETEKLSLYQLATVDAAHKPHVRTLVHREFLTPLTAPAHPLMLTTTDIRSAKAAHIARDPAVELAVTLGTRPVALAGDDDDEGSEEDRAPGAEGRQDKEARVLTTALELALVVLDGSMEVDGGRSLSLEHTALLLATGEWAGEVFQRLEKGVLVRGALGVSYLEINVARNLYLAEQEDLVWAARDWLGKTRHGRWQRRRKCGSRARSSIVHLLLVFIVAFMFAARLPKRVPLPRPARAARTFASSSSRRSDALFVHRDTTYNNPKIPFEFTPENMKRAQEVISHYPPQYKKAAVIPLLDLGQRQNKGWTSISVMNYIAKLLELPPMRVYEVATFYTMFNREPIGQNFVQVCTTTPCMLRGSTDILNTVTSHLGGIHPGQTTKDGKFTVVEVECQGACSNAPMIVVNDDFYEDLTPETTKKILDAFSKGQKPKPGPQSGRITSENSAGLTALASKPYGPGEFCTPEFS